MFNVNGQGHISSVIIDINTIQLRILRIDFLSFKVILFSLVRVKIYEYNDTGIKYQQLIACIKYYGSYSTKLEARKRDEEISGDVFVYFPRLRYVFYAL